MLTKKENILSNEWRICRNREWKTNVFRMLPLYVYTLYPLYIPCLPCTYTHCIPNMVSLLESNIDMYINVIIFEHRPYIYIYMWRGQIETFHPLNY